MSTVRYYVADSVEVMAAWNAHVAAKQCVHDAGEAFAAMYPGAKAVFSYSLHGMRFFGLRFEPALTSALWTKPNEQQGNTQRPRLSLPRGPNARGITDRARAAIELKELLHAWRDNKPKGEAGTDELYRSLGVDWGNFWLGGINLGEHEGRLYISTSAELKAPATEITGSEFAAATAVTS